MRAIGFRQCLGQRQTEAGSARAPAAGRGGLTERLKRRLYIFFAHADAGIAHAQDRFAAIGERGRDDDLAAGTV